MPSLLTMLGRALGQPVALLGERRRGLGGASARPEASRQRARAGQGAAGGWITGGLGGIVGLKHRPGSAQWEQLVLP